MLQNLIEFAGANGAEYEPAQASWSWLFLCLETETDDDKPQRTTKDGRR